MSVFIKNFFAPAYSSSFRERDSGTPIIMQDNAPCHKAKTVLSFLEEERIAVMKWPPQSPDMIPHENVWKNRRRESSEQKSSKYR